MRGLVRITISLALAVVAFAFQSLEMPSVASACSCAGPPPPLLEAVSRGNVTVVVGTVGVALPEQTPITVETWFHGPFPNAVVWVMGGTQMASSCDIPLAVGQRALLVLYGGPSAPGANGLYSLSMCERNGVLGTEIGNAALAEAVAAFGPGLDPRGRDREPLPAAETTARIDQGFIWILGTAGLGLAALAAVFLFARSRRAA